VNIITRGVRNTFRNGIRAFGVIVILGLSIGLALSMLIARQAVDQKIESVKSSIGNTISVSPAGARGFDGGGEPLSADQISKITKTSHVTSVVSTLSDRLTTGDTTNLESAIEAGSLGKRFGSRNGGPEIAISGDNADGTPFKLPIMVTGTTDATTVTNIGTVKLSDGKQINAAGSANEALIGAEIATKNNLTVGSTFTAYGKDITVAGIIDSTGNRFAGDAIVMPLATLQTLSAQTGNVTAATVTVDSIDNIAATTSSLQTALGESADVVSQQENAETTVAPLEGIRNLSLFALIAAVITGAVIILLTMVMIVRERRREVGVMKAIGAKNRAVTTQFMIEASTFTLIAAAVGIVFSILTAGPITNGLVNSASSTSDAGGPSMSKGGPGGGGMRIAGGPGNFQVSSAVKDITDVSAKLDWSIVLYGLGAALFIALVGTVVASWFIVNIKPAEAIRSE